MLTQERLVKLLDYNPETGVFRWKSPKCMRVKPGDIAGCYDRDGYIRINIDGKKYFAHRLAWLYINGYFPENEIDHIDRKPNNNRIANLREVSRQCNMRNCKIRENNTSGITGVYWDKRVKKWMAYIRGDGKIRYLGRHKNRREAAKARWNAEKKYGFPNCNTTSSSYNFLKQNNLCST